jgi:hypothetical protein
VGPLANDGAQGAGFEYWSPPTPARAIVNIAQLPGVARSLIQDVALSRSHDCLSVKPGQ